MTPQEIEQRLTVLAQEAYRVQDACNLLAVVNGLSRVVKELRELLPSWEQVDSHPIVALWVDKIASLTEMQSVRQHETINKAYDYVIPRLPVPESGHDCDPREDDPSSLF